MPTLEVRPKEALAGELIHVVASGCRPGATVAIRGMRRDARGVTWMSRASFVVGNDGEADTSRDAPTAGTYTGVDPFGLLWSMRPPAGAPKEPFDRGVDLCVDTEFELVIDGDVAARDRVRHRFLANGVQRIVVREQGLHGTFFTPAASGPRPAILIVGGSKGGELTLLLAATFPTIRLVVADAPSGVVWQGFDYAARPPRSSWTYKGEPLPCIPFSFGWKGLVALLSHRLFRKPMEARASFSGFDEDASLTACGQRWSWPKSSWIAWSAPPLPTAASTCPTRTRDMRCWAFPALPPLPRTSRPDLCWAGPRRPTPGPIWTRGRGCWLFSEGIFCDLNPPANHRRSDNTHR